jgi:hypothetical protein
MEKQHTRFCLIIITIAFLIVLLSLHQDCAINNSLLTAIPST